MGKRGAVPVDGDGSGAGMKKCVDIGEVLDIRKKYRIYAGYTGSDKKRSTDFSEKNSSFTLPIRKDKNNHSYMQLNIHNYVLHCQ